MSRYRFALRPKWILSHLFVLLLVVAMIGACIWQLDRLQGKKDRNARVSARSTEPAVAVQSLVRPGAYDAVDGLEFRSVTATGAYQANQEVLIRSRSNDGAPGSWVLTPLRLANGDEVMVNRGWISNSGQLDAVPRSVAAPAGRVTVTGLIRKTETRGSFGPTDPPTGRLENLARVDVGRLTKQIGPSLLPLYVQLASQSPPAAGTAPEPVPKPVLDEGPHLGYAVQWAIFTTVALIGYPLILRRRAREIEREGGGADLDGPDPDDRPTHDDPRLEGLAGTARSPDADD